MNILVLQLAQCEHPGIFRSFLEEDGHLWLADGTLVADSRQLAIAG